MSREIIPVNGFAIRDIFRDPANGVVLIHYDAPGVAGRFQITTLDYVPVNPYSVNIQNTMDVRSPVDGGPIPPGVYRIADLGESGKIHDLGSFEAPPVGAIPPPPSRTYPPNKEIEFSKEARMTTYGNGVYFFGTRSSDGRVYLPQLPPNAGPGVVITVVNWASVEGFGPEDAKPFDVYFNEKCAIPLMPGQKRSFTTIFTAQRNVLRWAPF